MAGAVVYSVTGYNWRSGETFPFASRVAPLDRAMTELSKYHNWDKTSTVFVTFIKGDRSHSG